MVKKGHRRQPQNTRSPQDRRAWEVSEAGSIFSVSIRVQADSVTVSSKRGISALLPLYCFQSFTSFPAQAQLADRSVLKICHCQKYQEELNVVPEMS